MIYLTSILFACSVTLVIVLLAQLIPGRSVDLSRRLAELHEVGVGSPYGAVQRRKRQARRERWEAILRELGERVSAHRSDLPELRRRMVRAGFHSPHATAIYWGFRIALPLLVGALALAVVPLVGIVALLASFWLAAMGFIAPSFYLDRCIRRRQKLLQQALPDALDLLVTCVEAGLGLNQALVRVSEEIRHLSADMSGELALVNLEIRAGVPREDALRNLGDRTGVEDIRSLTTMLIQTDRFGTSVAQALRVQSDTARTKRRQRAEEAAAKTTIKMLFPLLFCIFPGLFVVIIGPGAIQIYEALIKP
ncbi:MAG TPA: type II secretion system F family protein [Longimicrobiaceae bacterium]|nr:type II secretion system F family protein [Longimicrobiaceae bacterium]